MIKKKYSKLGRPAKNKEERLEELLKNKIYTQVSVRMPSDLHEKVRIYSVKNKISVNQIIIDQLNKVIDK